MSLNLLYTTVHIKTGEDGKQNFVLTNPRTQKSISFFRSGMSRFIEEVYKAKEALNKRDAVEDGIIYHGIIASSRGFIYGISANVYQNRKFIWCRLYVKDEPGELFGEHMNMNDNVPKSAGLYVKEFDAYATRIGVMLSIHDPFDKLLEMILTVPLESWTPPTSDDGTSASATGFVRSEFNKGGFQKRVKSTEIQMETDGSFSQQV